MSLGRAGLRCLHIFVLSFAISTIPGVLVAYDASLTVGALLAIWLSVALYFSVALLARSAASRRLVAVGLLSTSAAFAIYLICQYRYLGFDKGEFVVHLGMVTSLLPDLQGVRPHANAAASFIESAVPVSIALALTSRRLSWRLVLWVTCAIILYAIFLTASRGSWTSLAVAALLALSSTVVSRLLRRTDLPMAGPAGVALPVLAVLLAAIGLCAILALVAWWPHPQIPSFLASTLERADDRLTLYVNSFYLARDYLLTGAGLGNTFTMVYSRYSLLIYVPFLYYPHNLFLSVWLNQGIPGLVSFAGIGVSLCAMVASVIRASKRSPIFHGAWLGAAIAVIHGLTDASQYDPESYWVMPVGFVVVGLAASEARSVLTGPGKLAPARTATRVEFAGVFLAAALLLSLLVIWARPVTAAWHANMGALAETRADLSPSPSVADSTALYRTAEAEYRTALSIDPSWSPAQRRLGNLLVALDRFQEAVPLLESARKAEPANPAALKGLGLAYAWVGRTDDAALLLKQVAYPSDMKAELGYWAFYRGERNQPLLSAYALEALQRAYPEAITPDELSAMADMYRRAGQHN